MCAPQKVLDNEREYYCCFIDNYYSCYQLDRKKVVTRSLATVVGTQWTPIKQILDGICGKAGFQSPKASRLLPSDSVLLGRVCVHPADEKRKKKTAFQRLARFISISQRQGRS